MPALWGGGGATSTYGFHDRLRTLLRTAHAPSSMPVCQAPMKTCCEFCEKRDGAPRDELRFELPVFDIAYHSRKPTLIVKAPYDLVSLEARCV